MLHNGMLSNISLCKSAGCSLYFFLPLTLMYIKASLKVGDILIRKICEIS